MLLQFQPGTRKRIVDSCKIPINEYGRISEIAKKGALDRGENLKSGRTSANGHSSRIEMKTYDRLTLLDRCLNDIAPVVSRILLSD